MSENGHGPRALVPSAREAALGPAVAETTTPDVVAPEPTIGSDAKVPVRARLRDVVDGLHPGRIAGPHDATPLVLLATTAFFTSWDDAALGILFPEIRDDFGFSLQFLAVLGAVFGPLRLLIAPAAGYLADRVKRTRMVVIGAVSANLSSISFGLAPTLPWLVGARFVAETSGALTGPASLPLLTDYYPQSRRARVFAFMGVAGNAGAIVGPIVAGTIGALLGWRPTVIILGAFATGVSLLLLRLKEPVRGALDREALGFDADAAADEQAPMSWAEGWRASASIVTLRRFWYATPFLTTAGVGLDLYLAFYYADVFGVGPFGRGLIIAGTAVLRMIGVALSGPVTDRLLARNPERVLALFGIMLMAGSLVIVGLALSPVLWFSLLISVPLTVAGALILPATGAVVSLVVPARLRAFGLQTTAPWEMLGRIMVVFVIAGSASYGLQKGMLVLIPIYLIGAAILTSSATGVKQDIRAATAAAAADLEARRARAAGETKLLVCRDVDVAYDGTQVLFGVDLDVAEGDVLALLGTNGAGKSTLLRAIAGVQEASNGAIFLDGADITHRPPFENAEAGVVFVPGGRAVFPSLSVRDNLDAAAWMRRAEPEWIAERMDEVLGLFPELSTKLDQEAGTMSGGEQQMLALSQSLLMRPKLLMIDELSLGLAPQVVERLLEIVRRINDNGTTVILVEQSVNVALTIAERAVFMEKGRILYDGPTDELLSRGDLVRSIFLSGAGATGRRLGTSPVRRRSEEAETVLTVEGLGVRFGGVQALHDVSLTVDAGEILGVIGPNGAGKTTLFDAVSGYVTPHAGTIRLGATDLEGLPPDARARLGLGRSFQNARLFPSLTVAENIAVALERHVKVRNPLHAALWTPAARRSERKVWRRVDWLIELLNLDAYRDKFVGELSTGSRRMVDLACIMASEPSVLLLDEPSSGLAQAEVESLGPVITRISTEAGCGVIVIEHDIPLVTGVSHRMLAMELGTPIASGAPEEVVAHPRVVKAYLGASDAVVQRSGRLADALATAGLTESTDSRPDDAQPNEPVPDPEEAS